MRNAKIKFKGPSTLQAEHSSPKQHEIATLEFAADMMAAKLELDMVKLADIKAEISAQFSSSPCDGPWLTALIGGMAMRMSAASGNARERSLIQKFKKSWADILSEFSDEQVNMLGGLLRKYKAGLMHELIKGRS